MFQKFVDAIVFAILRAVDRYQVEAYDKARRQALALTDSEYKPVLGEFDGWTGYDPILNKYWIERNNYNRQSSNHQATT